MTAPERASSPDQEVQSSMVKVDSLYDVETFGAPVFKICDEQAATSLDLGVDLDDCAYNAIFAIAAGEPWGVVKGQLEDSSTHPAVAQIEAELLKLHERGWQN